jgi:hypothetical protein
MSFAEKIDWPSIMESVARHLLGEPNPKLSNSRKLRWGHNGSMSVDLDKGTFYDHEAKIGGGVTDLIEYKTGCDHAAAVRWLQAGGYADRPTLRRPQPASKPAPTKSLKTIVATYDYHDESGRPLYQIVRYEPKAFKQRRRAEDGTWIWGLSAGEYMRKGRGKDWVKFDERIFTNWSAGKERATFADVRRVPYQLAELINAVANGCKVYVPEGEKDCDNLRARGRVATTCAGGAEKWLPEYNEFLRGADVVLLPHNDDPGRRHAGQITASLHGIAKRGRILNLARVWAECPDKGDVSDWFATGGTVDQLEALTEALPDWKPSEDAQSAVEDTPSVANVASVAWPEMDEAAYHGLAGEIV